MSKTKDLRRGQILTLSQSFRLICGITVAVLAFVVADTGLTTTDNTLSQTYKTAFKAETGRTAAKLVARDEAAEQKALFQLTAIGKPVVQSLFGPLSKGDHITINTPDGRLQTLQVTDVQPIPLANADSLENGSRLMLITCRQVLDGGMSEKNARLHFMVEQNLPLHQRPSSASTRPL